MRKRQVFLAFALVVVLVFVQGCKTVDIIGPDGQTQAKYRFGRLKAEESKDINTVYKAAVTALNEFELKISQKPKDALSAKIVARDAQDKKITVELSASTKNTTKVSIRAGTLAKASLIYQKIRDNLQ